MASVEYLKVLNEFYKLKNSYEQNYKNKINNLKKKKSGKNLTDNIKLIKKKCIACKKNGGTIFTINHEILKAVCGHSDNPCNLNIELHKGYIIHQDEFLNQITKAIELNKTKIISTKLSLLFGLEEEDICLKLFKDYKTDLNEALEQMQFLEEKQYNANTIEIQTPKEKTDQRGSKRSESSDTEYETITIEKKTHIQTKLKQLEECIRIFNDNVATFRKDNTKKSVLVYAIKHFSDNIQPIFNEIRQLKYDLIYITEENSQNEQTKYIINKIPTIISNKEITIKDYKVVSKIYI